MGYFAQDPAESLEFSERPDTLASDERGGIMKVFALVIERRDSIFIEISEAIIRFRLLRHLIEMGA
jgi:hypothetical protein